jgi:hypothetical protein
MAATVKEGGKRTGALLPGAQWFARNNETKFYGKRMTIQAVQQIVSAHCIYIQFCTVCCKLACLCTALAAVLKECVLHELVAGLIACGAQ